MRTFTVTWQAEWSSRKIPMMKMDIGDFVRQQGGKHVEFRINSADDPPPRPLLNLTCDTCATNGNGKPASYWKSKYFTPCPKCNGRNVRKLSPDELAVIEAAEAEEAAAAAEAEAAKKDPPVEAPARRSKAAGRRHKKHNYDKEGVCRVCKRKKPGRRPSAPA